MKSQRFVSALLVLASLSAAIGVANAFESPPACAHAPILIEGDADFTAANGVTGGIGTSSDPYVISGWCISAEATTGITVQDTTAYFEIRNVLVHSGAGGWADHTGVFLWNADHGLITGASVTGNGDGIVVRESSDVAIVDNDLTQNEDDGIFLLSSDDVAVEDNVVWNNKGRGIGMHDSADVFVGGNGISWNGHPTHGDGLFVGASMEVTVTDNNILYNGGPLPPPGLPLEFPSFLPVDEPGVGVNLALSTLVTVHHNNLVGNHVQARQSGGSGISWDDGYPSGGNFWHGYDGADECSGASQDVCPDPDGIGDVPVVLQLGINQDRYPLTDPVPGGFFIGGMHLGLAAAGAELDAIGKSLAAAEDRLDRALTRSDSLSDADRAALATVRDAASAILGRVEDYRASTPPLPVGPGDPPEGSGPFHALAVGVTGEDRHLAGVLVDLADPSTESRTVLEALDAVAFGATSIVQRIDSPR